MYYKSKKHFSIVVAVILFLITTACIGNNIPNYSTNTIISTETSTALPSITPTDIPPATYTPVNTLVLTATPSPFPTFPPPTPTLDFLDSPIANGFLLAPSTDPDCQLPCWQGLRIGQSNREDVELMFRETFGFSNDLRVFPDIFNIPDMEAIHYQWIMKDKERDIEGSFALYAMYDQETGILNGIRIDMHSNEMYKTYTPQQIIRELGSPSAIYVYYVGNLARLMLIYYEGVVSFSVIEAPLEQQVGENGIQVVANFCLNEMPTSSEDYIVEPFNDIAETSLTPLQNILFGEYLRSALSPIEDALGLTVDEFVEIALDDENPCIVLE